MKWSRDGEYRITSGKHEDDRIMYSIMKVQQGTRYWAVYHWPRERWIKTDGRVHQLTHLYDGNDGEAAKRACIEHSAKAQT